MSLEGPQRKENESQDISQNEASYQSLVPENKKEAKSSSNRFKTLFLSALALGSSLSMKAETKTNQKEDQNVIYVDDQNNPRLKSYQDSLDWYNYGFKELEKERARIKENIKNYKPISKSNLYNAIRNWTKMGLYKPKYSETFIPIDQDTKKILDKPGAHLTIGSIDIGDQNFRDDYALGPLKDKNAKGVGWVDAQYRSNVEIWKKPVVEIRLKERITSITKSKIDPKIIQKKTKPKDTSNSQSKLTPQDVLRLPIEKNEKPQLVNLQKKEDLKVPEKTGFTLRVKNQLYYLDKETLEKFEKDRTTFYESTEKGDQTEKHLLWRGNEEGKNIQQIAKKLNVELPTPFNTDRQEFEY